MVSGLGKYIRAQRTLLGMTQGGLARAIGATDRSVVTQIESGRTKLPVKETRRKIAAALGVRELDLLVAAGELEADPEALTVPSRVIALLPQIDALSDDNLAIVATVVTEMLKAQNKGGRDHVRPASDGTPSATSERRAV
jgi:transcriptional regulator with XRE-family HTH domain